MHSERDLIIALITTRNDQGEVVENTLTKSVLERKPVSSRKINSCLPFFSAAF
jgi:hypothetical protein